MSVSFRIISIGALPAHPLRHEKTPVRPGHGTTTLIESKSMKLLIDPSLPPDVLSVRLKERSGLEPESITHIFLTSFRPDLRQGLALFEHATWWISERERETVGTALVNDYKRLEDMAKQDQTGDEDRTLEILRNEIAILKNGHAAPDNLEQGVDLFPLYGRTPGQCGLLIAHPNYTVLICGDAIPTIEHLEAGQVLQDCVDIEQARESFQEAVEIADFLILGRDNLVINPMRRMF